MSPLALSRLTVRQWRQPLLWQRNTSKTLIEAAPDRVVLVRYTRQTTNTSSSVRPDLAVPVASSGRR